MYNAEEIFNIGVEIEKNGEAFYRKVAEKASDPDSKKLLEDLANWEKGHVNLFDTLKEALPEDFKSGSNQFDIDDETSRYFKAAADSHIFNKEVSLDAIVEGVEETVDIFRIALAFEKDSVVLYEAMKGMVSENMGRDKVDILIKEEMTHVAMMQEKIELFS